MTPWYAWALFIGGPFLCAAAGAGVMWLMMARRFERALDQVWAEGVREGRYQAQLHTGSMVRDDTTTLIETGHFGRHADHTHWCPGCDAGDQTELVRAKFEAIRARLGLTPDLFPGFIDQPPARPLALPAAGEVIP